MQYQAGDGTARNKRIKAPTGKTHIPHLFFRLPEKSEIVIDQTKLLGYNVSDWPYPVEKFVLLRLF